MIIRRIVPLSAAKIAGVVYGLISLPFGLLVWVLSLTQFGHSGTGVVPLFGLAGGALAVIFLPIIYDPIGFVTTLIGAWFYNLVAGWVGGIRIEVAAESLPEAHGVGL
jgi:hypothetical protein